MRYDTPVYFQRLKQGEYLPDGNYTELPPAETLRYANVTGTTTEALQLVYGSLKQGSLTVRLNTHYTNPFDLIRIGEKRYKVDVTRHLRHKQTFIVSEVQ